MSVQPQQVDAQRIEGLRCGGEEFRAEVGGGNAADEVNQTAATHHRRRIRMGMGDGDGALLQRKPLKCHILQQGLAQRSLTVDMLRDWKAIGRRRECELQIMPDTWLIFRGANPKFLGSHVAQSYF